PPVGGPHPPIGSTRRAGTAALERAAAEVGAMLPIAAGIDRVRLIAGSSSPGSWRTVAEFAV
ncbi:2'-5' RNA ligase family protein, partial [Amycolatopsis mediterranei]